MTVGQVLEAARTRFDNCKAIPLERLVHDPFAPRFLDNAQAREEDERSKRIRIVGHFFMHSKYDKNEDGTPKTCLVFCWTSEAAANKEQRYVSWTGSEILIDRIERDIKKKFAINIVLHMDPIVVDDEHINALREKVGELIKEVDPRFTMHDFRMVEGPTHTNLIFDLVVPHKYPFTKGQIKELISDRISTEIGENYYAVMTIENSFVEDERR